MPVEGYRQKPVQVVRIALAPVRRCEGRDELVQHDHCAVGGKSLGGDERRSGDGQQLIAQVEDGDPALIEPELAREIVDAREGFRAGRPLQRPRRAATPFAEPVTEGLVRLGLDRDRQGSAVVVGKDEQVNVGRLAAVAVDGDPGFGFRGPFVDGPDFRASGQGAEYVGLQPGGGVDPGARVLLGAAPVLPVDFAFGRGMVVPVVDRGQPVAVLAEDAAGILGNRI